MGEGVIAKVEAGVEPGGEDRDAGVGLPERVEEVLFVDEADGGGVRGLEVGDEFGVDGGEGGGGVVAGVEAGQVVDGEGDLAIGRGGIWGVEGEGSEEKGDDEGWAHARWEGGQGDGSRRWR